MAQHDEHARPGSPDRKARQPVDDLLAHACLEIDRRDRRLRERLSFLGDQHRFRFEPARFAGSFCQSVKIAHAMPIEAWGAGAGAPDASDTVTVSRIESTDTFFDCSSTTTFSQGR